jgi:hypothetical protein
MIIVIKLFLVIVMVALLIVPTLDFLFYQPGKKPATSNSGLDSFLRRLRDSPRPQLPSADRNAGRFFEKFVIPILCVTVFVFEKNWGFLLLGFLPVLGHIRTQLTPIKRFQGDERDFEIRLKATATSLVITVLVPLIFSILWSFQVDSFTLLSAIFMLSEVIRIIILRYLAPLDTLEPEEELAT